jgi:CDP-diacylglycerol--serine O-phosphatidyltransferase
MDQSENYTPPLVRRGLRKSVYVIPSLFTTANVFCGFYAVMNSLQGAIALSHGQLDDAASRFDVAAVSIGWAVLFDFLDGRVARMTNSTTPFGVEFDSIADVLTFGIAPSLLAYTWGYGMLSELGHASMMVSFVYLICGAFRLARFNVQATKPALQKSHASPKLDKKAFVGMPIPAGASLIAAIIHFSPRPLSQTTTVFEIGGSSYVVGPLDWALAFLVLVVCLSLLMISTIRHTSFKTVGGRSRNPRFVILGIALMVLAVWYYSKWTLLAMASLYALHGIVGKLLSLARHRGHVPGQETTHAVD